MTVSITSLRLTNVAVFFNTTHTSILIAVIIIIRRKMLVLNPSPLRILFMAVVVRTGPNADYRGEKHVLLRPHG